VARPHPYYNLCIFVSKATKNSSFNAIWEARSLLTDQLDDPDKRKPILPAEIDINAIVYIEYTPEGWVYQKTHQPQRHNSCSLCFAWELEFGWMSCNGPVRTKIFSGAKFVNILIRAEIPLVYWPISAEIKTFTYLAPLNFLV
jgi:hypothetical protein